MPQGLGAGISPKGLSLAGCPVEWGQQGNGSPELPLPPRHQVGPRRNLRERWLHPQEADASGGAAGGHDPRRPPLWLGRGPGPT